LPNRAIGLGRGLQREFTAIDEVQQKARAFDDLSTLVEAVASAAKPGDYILVMSNGGFGGIHQKLLDALQAPVRS
jgi:UDP-N-acetylmuramate: L-alanyl-gamma-D-glutamyl-meso-diaminopimelate ligase